MESFFPIGNYLFGINANTYTSNSEANIKILTLNVALPTHAQYFTKYYLIELNACVLHLFSFLSARFYAFISIYLHKYHFHFKMHIQ